jgi:hypothetical protein
MSHPSEIDTSVTITTLGSPQVEVPGRLTYGRGTRMRLILNLPLPAGAFVRVDGRQFLLLGEVCHCESSGPDYVAALRVEHRLDSIAPEPRS